MNVRKNMTIGFALAALALGLTTTVASAETRLTGSFELPGAVYFGDTLLQPGQYTIWMNAEARDRAPAIHVRGEGVTKTIFGISKPRSESGRNCLKITQINGTYVLSAFDTGLLGRSYTVGMTRKVRAKTLSGSAGPGIAVPVSTAAGF